MFSTGEIIPTVEMWYAQSIFSGSYCLKRCNVHVFIIKNGQSSPCTSLISVYDTVLHIRNDFFWLKILFEALEMSLCFSLYEEITHKPSMVPTKKSVHSLHELMYVRLTLSTQYTNRIKQPLFHVYAVDNIRRLSMLCGFTTCTWSELKLAVRHGSV